MAKQAGRFESCCGGLCGAEAFESCCEGFERFKTCPKRARWRNGVKWKTLGEQQSISLEYVDPGLHLRGLIILLQMVLREGTSPFSRSAMTRERSSATRGKAGCMYVCLSVCPPVCICMSVCNVM